MKKLYALIFVLCPLIAFPGCASSRQYTDIAAHLNDEDKNDPNHKDLDTFLKHYFTAEAYETLKTIPLIDGPAINAYVAGVNFWSNLASFITFNGVGRKVICPKSTLADGWGIDSLIHEYIHHLDDMDRDGESEWIDHDEFKRAYKLMANDMQWKGIVLWTESRANAWYTDAFGIGHASEHIAYVGQQLVKIGGPDYMRHVFRRMLKLEYNKNPKVTTTDGKTQTLHLD